MVSVRLSAKDFMDWLKAANPDVICLQEIKAEPGSNRCKSV
jgi:exonuclease III